MKYFLLITSFLIFAWIDYVKISEDEHLRHIQKIENSFEIVNKCTDENTDPKCTKIFDELGIVGVHPRYYNDELEDIEYNMQNGYYIYDPGYLELPKDLPGELEHKAINANWYFGEIVDWN